MGRTALLLVLALAMAMGMISFQIYRSSDNAADYQYGYLKYMHARNLSRAAVHATLRTFDRGQTPAVNQPNYFNNGAFQLNALTQSTNGDTLHLVTQGTYAESTYVMRVTLFRSSKPFPTVGAAIAIRATPVSFSLSGHPEVDGHNYDITGTTLVGSGDKAGVATMKKTDSAAVASAGGSNISGVPPVKVDTTTIDPLAFLDIYKNNADFTYNTPGTYSSQTWGDINNPVIVYCNAGDDTSYSIKFAGGCTGCGILIVRGNLQYNGNLNFVGLVIVDGFNTIVSFGGSGTPAIVGGIIIAGNAGASVTLKGSGSNAKAVYSSAALDKAKNIGKLRYYTILDWFE